MKLKNYYGYLRLFFVALLIGVASGCDWVWFDAKGPIGKEQGDLILLTAGLMLIVVIPVFVMSIAFFYRYRESNKNAEYDPTFIHSGKAEMVIWGVPIILITVLSIISYKAVHKLDPYRPIKHDKPALNIEVVSLDFKWLFIYPEQGVAAVNELYIPVNTPVTFHITSDTTMSTLSIPYLGGMVYGMGGQRTKLNLLAEEEGQFFGYSGNYTGVGHSAMRFTTHSVSDEVFTKWVRDAKKSSNYLDFVAFKKLGERGEMVNHRYPVHPVKYYGRVESGLFRKVIGQYKVLKDLEAVVAKEN